MKNREIHELPTRELETLADDLLDLHARCRRAGLGDADEYGAVLDMRARVCAELQRRWGRSPEGVADTLQRVRREITVTEED